MNAKEIGEKLVAYCQEGKAEQCQTELYADDIVSVEAGDPPAGGERTTKGLKAVKAKGKWWEENHEVHESSVEGPFPHGDDKFAVIFRFDITNKPSGMRMKMEEVGVFTCEGSKVKKEEFFYSMG